MCNMDEDYIGRLCSLIVFLDGEVKGLWLQRQLKLFGTCPKSKRMSLKDFSQSSNVIKCVLWENHLGNNPETQMRQSPGNFTVIFTLISSFYFIPPL